MIDCNGFKQYLFHVLVGKGSFLDMPLFRATLLRACLYICLLLTPCTALADQHVVLQLRWDHQFQFAGYYEALWQGYYAREGLDVEIRSAVEPDMSVLSAVREVQEGRADFGIGASNVLIANDKGASLVILASILQQSGVGFFALKSTNLESPSDLLRLRVARIPNDIPDVEFQAMLIQEGLDPKDVSYRPHKPGLEPLLKGDVDVIPGYRITIPYLAESQGVEFEAIYPINYGITCYGDSLFCRNDLLERDKKLVDGFVFATLRGWNYALKNPEHTCRRIATRLARVVPVDNVLAFNLFQAKEITSLIHYPFVAPGHINPLRWKRMHQQLKACGLVRNEFSPSCIYDPTRAAAERRHRWFLIVGIFSIVGSFLTIVLLLWIFTLRRTVRARTRELEQSREHYRTVADFTYDWEYWLSPENQLLYVSPSCERVSGYTAKEFQEDPELLLRIVHPDDREMFRRHIETRSSDSGPRYLEFRIVRKDGQSCWIGHLCQQIFSSSGQWLGERGSNRDISQAKLLEAKREDVERILRHDLRSPLLALYAGLRLLDTDGLDEEDKTQLLPELRQSAKDMIDMMDALQSMSKIEDKTYVLKTEEMDLYELLVQAAGDVAHNENIRISPLDEHIEAAPFVGDRGLCRSMFTNLLRNAVEARGEKAVSARLDVRQESYLITIHNAMPVPPEMRKCFFDKFATAGKTQGTGLGTYSARLAAEIHGGEISFTTSENEGTTLFIRLPRKGAPQQDTPANEP